MADHSLMPALGVSASALDAQSHRMRVIAANIANAHTTRDANGNVYRRRDVVFASELDKQVGSRRRDPAELKGVRVDSVQSDNRPLKRVYEPNHPDADAEGYVSYPDINVVEEMTNMLSAMRAYEANVSTITTSKAMFTKALEIGR